MNDYERRGNVIYSPKGRPVAEVTDAGEIRMAPGMAGPHSRAVREFLAREPGTPAAHQEVPERSDPAPDAPAGPPGKDAVNVYVGTIPARHVELPEEVPGIPEGREEWTVASIPEEDLPPFSPELGNNTPGFRQFCSKHKLSGSQIAALVRRLTARLN